MQARESKGVHGREGSFRDPTEWLIAAGLIAIPREQRGEQGGGILRIPAAQG